MYNATIGRWTSQDPIDLSETWNPMYLATEVADTETPRYTMAGRDLAAEHAFRFSAAPRYIGHDGTWVSHGAIKGDSNLYRYAMNSPTNATDPSGLIAIQILENFCDYMVAQVIPEPPAPKLLSVKDLFPQAGGSGSITSLERRPEERQKRDGLRPLDEIIFEDLFKPNKRFQQGKDDKFGKLLDDLLEAEGGGKKKLEQPNTNKPNPLELDRDPGMLRPFPDSFWGPLRELDPRYRFQREREEWLRRK